MRPTFSRMATAGGGGQGPGRGDGCQRQLASLLAARQPCNCKKGACPHPGTGAARRQPRASPADRSRLSVYMCTPGAPLASSRWHIMVPRLIPYACGAGVGQQASLFCSFSSRQRPSSPSLDTSTAAGPAPPPPPRLDRLVAALDGLQRVGNVLRHGRLAEGGHALEAAVGHDGHHAGQDGGGDAHRPAPEEVGCRAAQVGHRRILHSSCLLPRVAPRGAPSPQPQLRAPPALPPRRRCRACPPAHRQSLTNCR